MVGKTNLEWRCSSTLSESRRGNSVATHLKGESLLGTTGAIAPLSHSISLSFSFFRYKFSGLLLFHFHIHEQILLLQENPNFILKKMFYIVNIFVALTAFKHSSFFELIIDSRPVNSICIFQSHFLLL